MAVVVHRMSGFVEIKATALSIKKKFLVTHSLIADKAYQGFCSQQTPAIAPGKRRKIPFKPVPPKIRSEQLSNTF
jgi:hypothetical protein